MSGDRIVTLASMSSEAELIAQGGSHLGQTLHHIYDVECYGPDGVLKWKDSFHNLVTTAGLNKYLDATLKTGLASPSWNVGLITGPGAGNTYVVGDTMASHAGWAENTTYVGSTRPAWTPGAIAAGAVSNSGSKAAFTITGNTTLAGCFMTDAPTKGGSSGTLLGEGNFSGGDRLVQTDDTINVTISITQS